MSDSWGMADATSVVFLKLYAAATNVGDAVLASKAIEKLMTRSDWRLERDKDDKWICNLKGEGEIPVGLDLSGPAAAAFVSDFRLTTIPLYGLLINIS